jgi:alcohol dehydrogenase (NADP+)
MLKLVADHKIKPWIEELPMSKAGEAVERLKKNDVKYRFVLKNDIN